MRKHRKEGEDFFAQILIKYFQTSVDVNAFEIPNITDSPDMAISSSGKVTGIEFSQFPSRYIIENFHKKRPTPVYTKNKIEGHLSVYPFEPHRWVHEVLDKKRQKICDYKKRINADEMWLVMHCHSTKHEWPMSNGSQGKTREAEALLMRFGTRQYRTSFDRILYIYADGTIVDLTYRSGVVPSAVTLPDEAGYPAVTAHQFSFSFDVPLPDLGVHEYHFDEVEFTEMIVPPIDDWMAERHPDIERPIFRASARVDSEKMRWKVFRGGVLIADNSFTTGDQIGKTMYMHLLLEWSIQPTTFTIHTDVHNDAKPPSVQH